MKKNRWFALIVVLFLALTVVVTVGVTLAAMYAFNGKPPAEVLSSMLGEGPQLTLSSPLTGTQVTSGDLVMVRGVASSPKGIGRVLLEVDGKEVDTFLPRNGVKTQESVWFGWFASQVGAHTLRVTAFDAKGKAGTPAVVGVVVAGLPAVNAGDAAMEVAAGSDGQGDAAAQPGVDANAGVPAGNDAANNGGAADPAAQPGVDAPAGDAPAADAPGDGGDAAVDNGNPPADDGNAPADNGNVPAEEGNADLPPNILHLILLPSPNEDGSMSFLARVVASDDIELARVELWYSRDAGQQQVVTADCQGLLECELNTSIDLGVGEWLVSARAVDSIGQASWPLSELVQVLAPQEDGPAVAVDDAGDAGGSDWLDGILGDVAVDLNVPVIDWRDFIAGWEPFGNDADAAPLEAMANNDCLKVEAQATEAGAHFVATITCALTAEANSIIRPDMKRVTLNSGLPGIGAGNFPWREANKTSLAAGETLEWDDVWVSCGAEYGYTVRIDQIELLEVGSASKQLTSPVMLQINTLACPAGGAGDVTLTVSPNAAGNNITWVVPPELSWPQNLAAEGAFFTLVRFDAVTNQKVILQKQSLSMAQLAVGGSFEAQDATTQCGIEYFYTLLGADTNSEDVPEARVFLRKQQRADAVPCQGNLDQVSAAVEPYFDEFGRLKLRSTITVPPGTTFPEGEGVVLWLLVNYGEPSFEPMGDWMLQQSLPISADVRANGAAVTSEDRDAQFGTQLRWRLVLARDRVDAKNWPVQEVAMPLSPPMPPELIRLRATNNCPNGAPRCVVVEWQPYVQSARGEAAPQIHVIRKIGAIEHSEFTLNVAETSFVDTSPFMREYDLVNGEHVVQCDYDVDYAVDAFDANGHSIPGWDALTIRTPDCDVPWNVTVEAR